MMRKYVRQHKRVKHQIFSLYKNILEQAFLAVFIGINLLPKGRVITSSGLEKIWNKTYKQSVGSQTLLFHTPNWLTEYRARTLLTKEPETIAWLNRILENSVFFDIGANIGVYSVYAASIRKAQVIAFEPSFLNLELLYRNIQSNHLENKITVIPMSLSNSNQIENLYMETRDNIWGGAHNSSGLNTTQDGKPMEEFTVSSQVAISLDSLSELVGLPVPAYIKIDVDGLESIILAGAQKSLAKVKEILIEVDKRNVSQISEVKSILSALGFIQERYVDTIELEENQIWVKKGDL
jgi:FkbM family methyltransferase